MDVRIEKLLVGKISELTEATSLTLFVTPANFDERGRCRGKATWSNARIS